MRILSARSYALDDPSFYHISSELTVVFCTDRARTETEDATHESVGMDSATPVKLDASAQAHIEKHRYVRP